jgi:ribosome recycling factor
VPNASMANLRGRMERALTVLNNEFLGLRTGRASAALFDPIRVEVYGTKMPLTQLATVSILKAKLLSVQVWDLNNVNAIEKAIRESELGLNPTTEGQVIKIPVPELNEERRREISKIAGKYAEQARISIRNIRRDGMEKLKREEKGGDISEDEHRRFASEVQSLTDEFTKKIDGVLAAKEKDILQV